MAIMLYKASNTNFTMNGDYTLQPLSCLATFNLNDTWQLDIDIPEGNEDFVVGAVISVDTPYGKKQLYRIYSVDRNMDQAIATAYPIFMDAKNDCFLWDVRPTNKNGQDALNAMLASNQKYTAQSNIATMSTAYYVQKNFIEALNGDDENAFLKRWGGEVAYQNYNIIVNDHIGSDNGLRVEFGFNLTGLQEQVDMTNVVTRIIPKAYNGYTLPNNETVDSPLINNYPIVYTKVVEYTDVKLASDASEDDQENGTIICQTMDDLYAALRQKANSDFADGIDLPSITYDVDMVDLSKTDMYADYADLLSVQLGDTAHIKNKRMNIETTARVITLVYDCITQKTDSLTLGDYEANYFDNVSSVTNSVSQVIEANTNTVMGDKIAGVINMMNTYLRAQKNIAQKQDVRAILFEDLDPDSPTYGALCIGTQGIQIAKERNETNTDWVWGTAINFESVIANYIITGILSDKLGNFFLNLDTGELQMKNGTFEGTLNGATINGGEINGTTINTDQNLNVGNDIYIGNQQSTDLSLKHIYFTPYLYIRRLQINQNTGSIGIINESPNGGAVSLQSTFQGVQSSVQASIKSCTMQVNDNTSGGTGDVGSVQVSEGFSFISAGDPNNNGDSRISLTGAQNASFGYGIYFQSYGNINSQKQITVTSDKRLKENIRPIDLSKLIDLIDVKSFNYIGSKQKTVGVIAQDFVGTEFEDIILRKDGKGFYAVDYNVILMALVQYIQEMKGDNNNANIN